MCSCDKDSVPIPDSKVNGFSRPLPALQVATWIVYGYLNISFHAIFGGHPDTIFLIFNAAHFILSFIVFTFAYATTKANVQCELLRVRQPSDTKMTVGAFREKYPDLVKDKTLCWCKYCEWYVAKSSKHCRACNRCTDHFDHHCRWLNNCVSKDNYFSFFMTICFTETILIYEIALGILMLMKQIDITTEHIFCPLLCNETVLFALISFHLFIAASIAIPLIQLIFFHIYLYQKQMTTYEWVVEHELAQSEKEEEKMREKKKNEEIKKQKIKNKYIKEEETLIIKHNQEEKNTSNFFCCFTQSNEPKAEEQKISESQRLSEVNTNLDVKLSGLSSGISVADMKGMDASSSKEEDGDDNCNNECCVSILSLRKRNSIHVAFGSMFGTPKKEKTSQNKYTNNNNNDTRIIDIDEDDDESGHILFGPGHIQSVYREDTTDTDRDVHVSDPNIIDSDFEHQYM